MKEIKVPPFFRCVVMSLPLVLVVRCNDFALVGVVMIIILFYKIKSESGACR